MILCCTIFANAVVVPSIISQQSFLSQSSTSVTLFTPEHAGVFRVSLFIESGSAFSNTPLAQLTYTANSGSVTTNGICLIEDTHTASCVTIIRSTASNAVSLNVSATATYDMYAVVEHIM
jgi:hypothetical protein